MGIGELVGGLGSVVGGIMGSDASGDAADAQIQAAQQAAATQMKMYEQNRTDLAPWRTGGGQANSALMYLMGLDPGASGNAGGPSGQAPTPGAAPTQPANNLVQGQDGVYRLGPIPDYNMKNDPNIANNPNLYAQIHQGQMSVGGRPGYSVPYYPTGSPGASTQVSATNTNNNGANSAGYVPPSAYQGMGGRLLDQYTGQSMYNDPGYQFRLEQGNKALQNSLLAKGGMFSGAAGKSIADYNSGMASQEFGAGYNRFNNDQTNLYNRLMALSNQGQSSAAQTANLGAGAAGQIANSQIGAGDAAAMGAIGGANAWRGALGGVSNGIGSYLGMTQGLNSNNTNYRSMYPEVGKIKY